MISANWYCIMPRKVLLIFLKGCKTLTGLHHCKHAQIVQNRESNHKCKKINVKEFTDIYYSVPHYL
jgi:hypothetical protein